MKLVQLTKALKLGAKALVVGARKTATSTFRQVAKAMKEEGVNEAKDSGYVKTITEAHKALTNKRRKKVLKQDIREVTNAADEPVRSVVLPVKTDRGNKLSIQAWWNPKSKSVTARTVYKYVNSASEEKIGYGNTLFFTSVQDGKIVVLTERDAN